SAVECTVLMWLHRGSACVSGLTVRLKIGRPSGSVPTGLIRLMSVTTGRLLPFAYITPTEAVMSCPNARSTCTLLCHVWATTKCGPPAQGAIFSVPVEMPFGNGGAPACVGVNV